MLQLIHNQPRLALLGNDERVVARHERDTIEKRLNEALRGSVVSKTKFAVQYNVSLESLGRLEVDDVEFYDTHDEVVTSGYASQIWEKTSKVVERVEENRT